MRIATGHSPSHAEASAMCWSAACALCVHSATYVKQLREHKLQFIRAIYRVEANSVKLERATQSAAPLFGLPLQQQLKATAVDLPPEMECASCWLTLTSTDGELVYQHAFFAMASGNPEPVLFELPGAAPTSVGSGGSPSPSFHSVGGTSPADPLTPRKAALFLAPSPTDRPVVPPADVLPAHHYDVPHDSSLLSVPSHVAGRTTPSRPTRRPEEVEEQRTIARPATTIDCGISFALPRLQSSAPYVPQEVTLTPKRRDRPLALTVTNTEDTGLVEPSPWSHQKPDGARRERYSPQREDLWMVGEKSMTRYTGITWIDEKLPERSFSYGA